MKITDLIRIPSFLVKKSASPVRKMNKASAIWRLDDTTSSVRQQLRYFDGRDYLRNLYVCNWTIARAIDIIVDDMFVKWRDFGDDAEVMRAAENQFGIRHKLSRAMKWARLYGSAIVVFITDEADLSTPLNPDALRRNNLQNVIVVDKYNSSIEEYDQDIISNNYRLPTFYRIYGKHKVHASRVIRFDGIPPDSNRPHDWGESILKQILDTVEHDRKIFDAAAYLMEQASIDVIKLERYRQALASGEDHGDIDTPSLRDQMQTITKNKSIYRTLFMDSSDDYVRTAYQFGGVDQLMSKFQLRLSAAVGVPATRFWGQSPVGMNATGDSDAQNWAIHVGAMQEQMLSEPLQKLDAVLAKNAGLAEVPAYTWKPLLKMSEADMSTAALTRAQLISQALMSGVIDEAEARKILRTASEIETLPDEIDFELPSRNEVENGDS